MHYDVIVIGSGGGTKLVVPVANQGYKVAIIEKEKLGGTCLNRGCIPSKMLIHPADIATAIKKAGKYFIDAKYLGIDFSALVKEVNATIDKDSQSIAPIYERHENIDYYHGHARFSGPKEICVNNQKLTADKIFITVGADAQIPNIEGLENTPFMTYRDALKCEKQPKSLIVLGGGYIATELGYFFGALGTNVEFIVRSQLVKQEDHEVQEEFTRIFSEQFPIRFGFSPKKVRYEDKTFHVICENKQGEEQTFNAEGLLVATGVAPLTKDLGLEHTDVTTNDKGYIEVDNYLKTKAPGIWAFGDCIGKHLFRHSANYEGEYLFRTLFIKPSMQPIDYSFIPHAVFTHPQIGSIGKTEEQLQKEHIEYVVGKTPYIKSGMGMALKADHGFVKLLFDKHSKKLLGGHIIGEEASNMIHMVIAFMNMDATLDDMLNVIYIHPALPELVRNAARNARVNFKQ